MKDLLHKPQDIHPQNRYHECFQEEKCQLKERHEATLYYLNHQAVNSTDISSIHEQIKKLDSDLAELNGDLEQLRIKQQ